MDKPHVLDILAKKQGCFVSDLRLNPINRRAALADLLLLDDSPTGRKNGEKLLPICWENQSLTVSRK